MLSKEDALYLYAKMFNTGDYEAFLGVLADSFEMSSQHVLEDMVGKDAFRAYIEPKLITIAESDLPVFAELGILEAYGERECVVLAQGDKDQLACVAYIGVENGKVARLDLCVIPPPNQAIRSGIYPGITDN